MGLWGYGDMGVIMENQCVDAMPKALFSPTGGPGKKSRSGEAPAFVGSYVAWILGVHHRNCCVWHAVGETPFIVIPGQYADEVAAHDFGLAGIKG